MNSTTRFLVGYQIRPTQEAIIRKLAIALVAAITVGAAAPAMAQVGFYAGPAGIGIGVGPGYYGYYGGPYYGHYGGPYWHHHNQWHHRYYVR